jgi:hypothetical protein
MLIRLAASLALLLPLTGTSAFAQATPPAPAAAADPLAVTGRFVAGFNHHNLGEIVAETAPEVQWLSVAGDRIATDAAGQTALRDWMARYLGVYKTIRMTLEQPAVHGPFVSAWERVRWIGKDGGERGQARLVVYQVEDGRIQRVWRYPAQP